MKARGADGRWYSVKNAQYVANQQQTHEAITHGLMDSFIERTGWELSFAAAVVDN